MNSSNNIKTIPFILLGTGGVGRALLRQLIASDKHLQDRCDVRFVPVAVADSRTWRHDSDGVSRPEIEGMIAAKEAGQPLPNGALRPDPAAVVQTMHDAGVRGAIVVDCTAADGMAASYARALDCGYGVAMANKKVMAGPWADAARFYTNPAVRHESTVGGGQPVIATARYLADINDRMMAIEGQLSGTLGYLCQQLDAAVPFSQAVAAARQKGFTEPDPREDLGGVDVMRKLLIVARLAGWPLEGDAIEVESLYPDYLAGCSVPEFMNRISEVDDAMAARVEEARASGHVLRYVGRITAAGGEVGLRPIPSGSPLGALKYVAFHTGLYDDEPLMICGKGAGVEMTAGGVLGDMITLGREWL